MEPGAGRHDHAGSAARCAHRTCRPCWTNPRPRTSASIGCARAGPRTSIGRSPSFRAHEGARDAQLRGRRRHRCRPRCVRATTSRSIALGAGDRLGRRSQRRAAPHARAHRPGRWTARSSRPATCSAPLEDALADPGVGICGPFGIVTHDLREFEEAPAPGDCDAIEGYLMAFRREMLTDAGLFDEKFQWYRTADIEYSFRVKDAGLRTVVVPVPVDQARAPDVVRDRARRARAVVEAELLPVPGSVARPLGPGAGPSIRRRTDGARPRVSRSRASAVRAA